MSLRECRCPKPRIHPNPRLAGTCVRCGYSLLTDWSPSDETTLEFLDRLAQAFPVTPEWFERFRALCLARERHGRKRFGYAFLQRDNVAEGAEEAADGVLYAMLDVLKDRRAGRDENWDLALTAAWHFAQAFHYLTGLDHKRTGAPRPD